MYVGLKQPLGDGERCVISARAAAKETRAAMVLNYLTDLYRSIFDLITFKKDTRSSQLSLPGCT